MQRSGQLYDSPSLCSSLHPGFEQKNITFSPDWYAYTVSNASYPYRVDYYAAADDAVHMSVRLVLACLFSW